MEAANATQYNTAEIVVGKMLKGLDSFLRIAPLLETLIREILFSATSKARDLLE